MSLVYGIGGLINTAPGALRGNGPPAASFKGVLGQQYFDQSTSPPTEYIYNGSTWEAGGNAYATETTPGIVELATTAEMNAGTSTTLVPPVKEVFDYVNSVVIAGAPVATEVTAGIGQLATDAEAVAGTASTPLLALLVTPSNLTPVFAAPPAIGGTTAGAGTFTGLTADGTGTVSLTSNAAALFDVTGAGNDLTLSSDAGRVIVNGEEAAANAITLLTAAGGIDVDAALQINIASSQNAVDAIRINASAGGIDIDAVGAATEDINITNTGGSIVLSATESAADSIVIQSTAGGIDILASGAAAGEDIDITATGSSVNITSTENVADSIVISSTNGGIDITAAGAAAGEDIDITATGSSINIVATEAAATAIVLNASNAAGGIDLSTGGGSIDMSSSGFVTMVPATDTQASPTAASTLNVNVGAVTFTGFVTAAAGTQVFTITNSLVSTTSKIFVSASNEGANDAQMTVTRVNRAAGSFLVTLTNNGAAALNGNITINFWVFA